MERMAMANRCAGVMRQCIHLPHQGRSRSRSNWRRTGDADVRYRNVTLSVDFAWPDGFVWLSAAEGFAGALAGKALACTLAGKVFAWRSVGKGLDRVVGFGFDWVFAVGLVWPVAEGAFGSAFDAFACAPVGEAFTFGFLASP